MSRLTGKIAFVTGAGGGIGRAVCQRFVEEGACVVAVDVSASAARDAVSELPGSQTTHLQCDISDSSSVREAIALAVAKFGGLSVLCNFAGGSSPQDGPILDAAEDEFWRTIKVDLFGTFAVTK
jgi:NAD(P)-dependent dehydrogenase (short-subunit alcohol dehydrogenase family)